MAAKDRATAHKIARARLVAQALAEDAKRRARPTYEDVAAMMAQLTPKGRAEIVMQAMHLLRPSPATWKPPRIG